MRLRPSCHLLSLLVCSYRQIGRPCTVDKPDRPVSAFKAAFDSAYVVYCYHCSEITNINYLDKMFQQRQIANYTNNARQQIYWEEIGIAIRKQITLFCPHYTHIYFERHNFAQPVLTEYSISR